MPHDAPPDFSRRADPAELPEWMDQPCSYGEFRACVQDLGAVNRWTFGYRPTLHFLEQVVASASVSASPLRIVDVGSGGGDALRRVSRWAERRRLDVALTGIDLNPHATRAAEEFSKGKGFAEIRWLSGDAFAEPSVQGADVVMSSLVTHHMQDGEIVAFLRWMERTAVRGWFINDLMRSVRAARLFRVLAKVMRWHPFVQHDGPVSFRRAFCVEDWHRLLTEADISLSSVKFTGGAPGRLCLTRLR